MADQAEKLRQYAGAVNRIGPGTRPGNCRVAAVTSGKGGVGKSCLVLNMALVLARMGSRVAVVDADLGLANLDILINALPRYTLADLLDGNRELNDVLITGPSGLRLVPAGSGLLDLANLDPSRRNRLLERLRPLEHDCDLVLFDTAAGLSHTVLDFVRAADDFIVVTSPEPPALADAYGILKAVTRRGGPRKGYVVVNFVRRPQQGELAFDKLQKVTRRYLPGMETQYLGSIGYDPAVVEAVQGFTPFVLSHPGSAAAKAVTRIARRYYLGEDAPAGRPGGLGSFLARLAGGDGQ